MRVKKGHGTRESSGCGTTSAGLSFQSLCGSEDDGLRAYLTGLYGLNKIAVIKRNEVLFFHLRQTLENNPSTQLALFLRLSGSGSLCP